MKRCSLLFLMLFQLAFCKEIVVSKNGEIPSVHRAIQLAKDGDVIRIKKGVYNEYNLDIHRSIAIIGENGAVIDGQKKGKIFQIYADGVSLKNLTLQNVGVSYTTDYAAVRLTKCKNFSIEKLSLKGLFFGIYLEKAQNGRIINNTITGVARDEYNSGNGIHLWYAKNVLIEGNKISGARDGIYFEFAEHSVIKNNISFNNLRYGLHFMFSNDNQYLGNTFKNNGTGVAVMFSKRIKMIKNKFIKNWGTAAYGILLKEIYDAELIDNKFIENTIAIQIEGSTRIQYEHNDFQGNGWAVKVMGAAYKNIFKYNNFSKNSFDLSYNSNLNDNLFSENYWSEYTGYDLDFDNYGDVPFRPVKLFSYIVDKTPETIILLRSLFIDIINFSEKVSPIFTPVELMDKKPKMTPYL